MLKMTKYSLVFFLILLVVCLGCATSSYLNDPGMRKERIQTLVHRILTDRKDVEALQELGLILIHTERYDRARKIFEMAYKADPANQTTLFYFGMCLEFCKMEKAAFEIYRRYTELPPLSSLRSKMKDRYTFLNRKMMRQKARELLRQEDMLSTQTLIPNSIIVFPFTYQGDNQDYAVLSKGLGEMMITDLSQIDALELIERIRLKSLMDEMNLGATGLVDSQTAVRCGRLLTSGKVIYGAYDVLGNERFHVSVEMLDIMNPNAAPLKASTTDVLKNVMLLEKKIVFGIINSMGLELTQKEKEKILRIPTKNMQAFITYCTGLEQEDAGQFEAAVASFQQAAAIDPGFEIAGEKAQETKTFAKADDKQTMLTLLDKPAVRFQESISVSLPSMETLINSRLQTISTNIGSNIVLGKDNRDSAEEAFSSSANIGLGELIDPPQPPSR